jgi:hypothetical protein
MLSKNQIEWNKGIAIDRNAGKHYAFCLLIRIIKQLGITKWEKGKHEVPTKSKP